MANKLYRQKNMEKVKGWQRAYTKTIKGHLMMTYHNMRGRVTGIQKKKAHLYAGLPILSRGEFYAWANANPEYHRLFREWAAMNFEKKLSPSINRINPNMGYVIGNIEFLPQWLNSTLGCTSAKRASNTRAVLERVYKNVR